MFASANIELRSGSPWASLRCAFAAVAAMLVFAGTSQAQVPSGARAKPPEARVALVIGNSDYRSAPLDNPANDASDLAAALEKQGFNVLVRENVGERGLKEAVDVFAKHLQKGDGVFVEGRLQVRQYDSKQTGKEVSVEIIPSLSALRLRR